MMSNNVNLQYKPV